MLLFSLSIPFFIIALISLLKFSYTLFLGKSTRSWLDQPGEIISSEIKIKKIAGRDWAWIPQIEYAYTIGEHQYHSTRIAIGLCPYLSAGRKKSSFFKATKFINNYPAGQPTTIYYCPEQPDLAVLQTGVDSDNNFFLILAILLIISGILLISLA